MDFEATSAPKTGDQKDKKPGSKQSKSRPAKTQVKDAEPDTAAQSDIFVQNGGLKPVYPFDCQKEFAFGDAGQSAPVPDNSKDNRAASAVKKAKTPSRSTKLQDV